MLLAASVALPASAGTKSDLEEARLRLDQQRAVLQKVTLAWQRTEARLAEAQDAEARARARIAGLESTLAGARKRFDRRVVEVYMAGGSSMLTVLLTSGSIDEVADRWEFASSVAQGDQDLATQVAVEAELVRRERAHLAAAVKRQAAAVAELQGQRSSLAAQIGRLADLEADLERKLAQETAAREALAVVGTGPGPIVPGAIQTCPVAGPNSFVDSFGWPRSGGRTHQGIDMIAPAGTPVVAAHAGEARQTSSALGGNGAVVYHEGSSDWTFYTHFSAFGASGPVSVGTVIGYVGSTGDTTVDHLHFEYHPGGGPAVNPYSMLLAAC